jgi:hypothetical protein
MGSDFSETTAVSPKMARDSSGCGRRMSDPLRQTRRMRNESSSRSREQLLLDIPRPAPVTTQRRHRPCSPARAAWWFQQMHQVVDKGIEVNAPGVR